MKFVIATLLIVIAVLVWRLRAEMMTTVNLQNQIAKLTTNLADKSKLEKLELQEKCATQAEKIFRVLGWDKDKTGLNFFQSHYNAKLGRCLMAVETTSSSGTVNKFLMDAFEQKEFAEYFWVPQGDKKYWEVPPKICKLTPPSTDESICKSEEEYKVFVALYME